MDTPPSPATSDAVWQRLSPKYRLLRHIQVALFTILLLLMGGSLGLIYSDLAGGAAIAVGIVVPIVVGIITDVLVMRRVKAWAYCERENDLWVQRGLILRRLSVIPYGRMQFVEVTAGPIDRMLKLATVQLHTAAAATDARIPGLDLIEAQRLRDQLAALGESRLSGL